MGIKFYTMEKIIYIIITALGFSGFANAQVNQSDTLALSLEQAKELGLKNRFDVKANNYDVEMAHSEVIAKKEAWIPNINLKGEAQYHPQIQSTLIPAGFAGLTEPMIMALGAKSINVFSLELNQPIFNPSLTNDVKQASNNEALQLEKKRAGEIQIKKHISLAYLNVQLRELQYKVAQQEEARFHEYFTVSEGKYNNGSLLENDYLHAKLDYENAHHQTIVTEQNFTLSIQDLCYQINIPADRKIKLTDKLVSESLMPVLDISVVTENRTEVQQIRLQQKGFELQERKQRLSKLPTLSLVGNYSYQYLNQAFFQDYFNSQWWMPYNTVGLRLSIPISGQFTNRTAVKLANFRILKLKETEQQILADINFEIVQASTYLNNAYENLQTTKASYELSQQVYKNQKAQLELGSFSYDALLTTEASLFKAENNYVAAVYQFMTAKLNYEVAAGKL